MSTSSVLELCKLMFVVMACMSCTSSAVLMGSSLRVGFYNRSCPKAETIVRNVVNKVISLNPGLGASLIRMHFHDCFVRGCDASILLDSTPGNPSEKENIANNPSLQGYEIIDEAKKQLESQCPQIVSCADIIAFAARDSVLTLGSINYAVQSGRRDGRISLKDDPTRNLPAPFFNLQQLQQSFQSKGLSMEEMVTLSGAHSIGVSHCSSFNQRLYSFNNNGSKPQDPSLDPGFASNLKIKCPKNLPKNVDPIVNQDFVTPNRLDNKYYQNVVNRRGLLSSDQSLMMSSVTAKMVRDFSGKNTVWAKKFAKAMVRMGSIDVITGGQGPQGEIRKNCRVVN